VLTLIQGSIHWSTLRSLSYNIQLYISVDYEKYIRHSWREQWGEHDKALTSIWGTDWYNMRIEQDTV